MSQDQDDRVRILSSELLHRGWASLMRYEVEITGSHGQPVHLDRLIEDHGNSAAVLPYDATRRTVLLSRQFRLAAHLNGHAGWLIEACSGMIDAGESAAEAVAREAHEELGITARDLTHVCTVFVSPGASQEKSTLFLARYAPADRTGDGGGTDAGEDIEILEMPLTEAMRAIAEGFIVDAKTVILLQALAAREMP